MRPAIPANVAFEPFQIGDRLDAERRYPLEFDPSFPLLVKTHEFPRGESLVPMSWHERLELFCPLSGRGLFRMGDSLTPFRAGDLLVVDHLCLHGVERYSGAGRRAAVITFLPELVAGAGALPCDLRLLQIFGHRAEEGPLLVHGARASAEPVRQAVLDLICWQAGLEQAVGRTSLQARMKSGLLRLLVLLDDALQPQLRAAASYEERRERLRRLAPLLDAVRHRLAEKTTVGSAARLLGMSESYFMRFFRGAAGVPFNAWLIQLRLVEAHRLLLQTDLPVSEIATATGFCDQSYFDRRFRLRFGKTPTQARRARRRGDPQ
jgi:AraC-like DNA-binding protein